MKGIQSPAEIEKLRQTLEDGERDTGEQLKKADAIDPNANKTALAASTSYQDGIRVELAKMTPAERRMPALVDGALREGTSATGNRITDRAGGGPPPPAIHNALWQTWKKLDWAAINRLVDHTR